MNDKKPVLLLVDDSQFSLVQVKKALTEDPYEILTASGGAEGLVMMETKAIDLVITDLLMPHISGLAFLGQVKQRFPNAKVIVCSADIQDSAATKAKALGAAAFLCKPVDSEELRRVVRLVLSQAKPPSELPITPKYADAFKEIFNIGVGRAAKALSKLVYESVKLSVPKLEILRPHQLASHMAESFADDVACVRQDFSGSAVGSAYLLLSAKSGLNLVSALIRDDETVLDTFSETDRALLVELGNILINSLVGTLANTLGIDFKFSQASCDIGSSEMVCTGLRLGEVDYVLYVETLFVVPGKNIGGNLVILMGSAGMGTLLKGIDRMF